MDAPQQDVTLGLKGQAQKARQDYLKMCEVLHRRYFYYAGSLEDLIYDNFPPALEQEMSQLPLEVASGMTAGPLPENTTPHEEAVVQAVRAAFEGMRSERESLEEQANQARELFQQYQQAGQQAWTDYLLELANIQVTLANPETIHQFAGTHDGDLEAWVYAGYNAYLKKAVEKLTAVIYQ